jgi:DNA-binding CsgD family transcriptional regulator
LLGESLSIRRAQHDDRGVAYATWALGRLALHQGHTPIANLHLDQARSRFRDLRDRFGTAFALHDLGLVALHDNDPRQAIVPLDEALALRHELGERKGVVESLEGLAFLARATGQARAAAELLGAAAEQRLILGTPLLPIERPRLEREVSLLRTALGGDPFAAAWTIGRSRSLDEAAIAATTFLSTLPSEPPAPAPVPAPAAERPGRSGTLSGRELDVLRLIAEGHTSREIADLLFLSHRTVSTHLTNIFNKLGVSSRSAAAAHAVRHHLV